MTRRKKKREPSRSEKLAEALVGVHSSGARDKEAMRQLVIASVTAFRQGVGISWHEMEEMLDALYDDREPYNEAREIDGRWRVGMRGNLDTPNDAVVTINGHFDDPWSERMAQWIADNMPADICEPIEEK